jgi:hypothetical protein
MVFHLSRLLSTAAAAAVVSMSPMWAEDADAKGVFLDRSAAGVRFDVTLMRGAERQTVPSSYEFRSGDQMLFQFSLNRDAFVYVLTRTIPGEPVQTDRFAGSRGIEILLREDSKAERPVTAYRLLFPLKMTGLHNRLSAGAVHTVPANGARFTMDTEPGIEKVYLVLSPDAIDMSRYFDMETGRMLEGGPSGGRSDHGPSSDLGAQMLEWSKNAQTSIAEPGSKGITVEGYGVSSNSTHPALVEVDLKHRRK